MCQRRDISWRERVADINHYVWNGACCRPGSVYGLCSLCNNYFRSQLNQIIGETRQAFRVAAGVPLFQYYIFPLDPAELFECLRECKDTALRLRVRFCRAGEDANYPGGLLRYGQPGTQPSRRARTNCCDEFTSPHKRSGAGSYQLSSAYRKG